MRKAGIHCYISGRVQGVFFRASTRAKAESLDITGWVSNLPDGRVEVRAFGEESKMEIFKEWLQQGPEAAKVTDVDCREIEWEIHEGFK